LLAAVALTLGCSGESPRPSASQPSASPQPSASQASAEQHSAERATAESTAGTTPPPQGESATPPVLDAPPFGAPPEIRNPYKDGADAQVEIDATLGQARVSGKRVLLVFGANWCVWCRRLEWVLRNDPGVREALEASWHVVHVDVGTRGSGTNAAAVARYGDPIQHGLPCLVMLDAQGNVVHTQETGALERGDRHDPARIVEVLNRFRAPS
jgi:thiol:disulfide interchange protein